MIYQFYTLQRLYTFTVSRVSHLPGVCKAPKHFQGVQAGYTMKCFKGSSNKLGPLGFTWQAVVGPLPNGTFDASYTRIEAALYPSYQAPFVPFWVTTNKIEKVLLLN